MAHRGSEFNFFQDIYVRIDIRIDSSISIRPMNTKFDKQVYLQDLPQMRLIKQVLVTSLRQDHATTLKHSISTTRVPMATKLGRMVTYLDMLLPIKSTWPSDHVVL